MSSKIVKNWITKRATAESSKKRYPRILERFCNFYETNPEGLIQEAEAERQKPLDDREDIAFQRLEGWFEALQAKGQTHDSSRNLCMVIKGFYSCSGIHVDWRKPKRKSKNQRDRNRHLSIEKADCLLDYAESHQLRAITAVLRDSALSPSDLCELNVEDLHELEPGWCVIMKERKKNRERLALQIMTFIGPIGSKYLHEWYRERERTLGPFKGDDPVFLRKNSGAPRKEETGERRLTVQALGWQFRELAKKAGLITKEELETQQNPYSAHKFRHLFTTVLKNAGMPDIIRESCLGHKFPGITDSYYDTCEETHFKAYKEYYWALWPKRESVTAQEAQNRANEKMLRELLTKVAAFKGLTVEEFLHQELADKIDEGLTGDAILELGYPMLLEIIARLLAR